MRYEPRNFYVRSTEEMEKLFSKYPGAIENTGRIAELCNLEFTFGKYHERRKRYHRAYYSLDAYDWTENYALEHSPSPEQLVMLAEERAECDRLATALVMERTPLTL